MNFLFWNLGGRPLTEHVCSLAKEYAADVLVLAEVGDAKKIEAALTLKVRTYYHVTKARSSRVHVFTGFAGDLSHTVEDGHYYTAVSTTPPLLPKLLLVGVHLPSKLRQSAESQDMEAGVLSRKIKWLEEHVGHQRTLVVGDFNMDPFAHGLVGAAGLHAVASASVAQRGNRIVGGQPYDFFYNPTWAHMSDRYGGPPGTYYRQASEHVGYFWHSLDQVLMRPALLDLFRSDGLKVLDAVGAERLTRASGRPSTSDHLPLLLTLSAP